MINVDPVGHSGKQTLRLALKIESMNKLSPLDHEDGSPSDG